MRGGKLKHININKFGGLSRDWVRGKNMFMCFLGGGVILMGEKKHINKISRKSQNNPVECLFVCLFVCMCVCVFFFGGFLHSQETGKEERREIEQRGQAAASKVVMG